MTTDIEIASNALVMLGDSAMQSFNDGTSGSSVAAALYPMVRDAVLAAHPWNHATAQFDMNRLAETPLGDYAYKFQLPPDTIRVVAVKDGAGRNVRDYRIQGTTVLCDAEDARLLYIFRADESSFPPHFTMALTKRLAAEFCIAITESTSRYDLMMSVASDAMKMAKSIDSQQDTPQAIEYFPLYHARGGSGRIDPSDGTS